MSPCKSSSAFQPSGGSGSESDPGGYTGRSLPGVGMCVWVLLPILTIYNEPRAFIIYNETRAYLATPHSLSAYTHYITTYPLYSISSVLYILYSIVFHYIILLSLVLPLLNLGFRYVFVGVCLLLRLIFRLLSLVFLLLSLGFRYVFL